MADALVAGVQYGLSSNNSQQSISLVLVKLTDSAYRAIEEYLRNGVSYVNYYFFYYSSLFGSMS